MENNLKGKNNIISFAWFVSLVSLVLVSMVLFTTSITTKFGALSFRAGASSYYEEDLGLQVLKDTFDSRLLIVLVILFSCVFGFLTFLMKKRSQENSQNNFEINEVRVFLSNVFLVLSGTVIISTIAVLLYQFIGGEFIKQDIIFSCLVLLFASLFFGYEYVVKSKKYSFLNFTTLTNMVSGVVIISAILSILVHVSVVGSPVAIKQRGDDLKKVADLSSLDLNAVYFFEDNQKLPSDMSELKNDMQAFGETLSNDYSSYEYRVISQPIVDHKKNTYTGGAFELCTVFTRERAQQDNIVNYASGDSYGSKWNHGIGRTCFTHNLNPKEEKMNLLEEEQSDQDTYPKESTNSSFDDYLGQ